MSVADLGRMRFGISPLMELAESLWIVSSRRVQPVHRGWHEEIRGRLRTVNMALLSAVVPGDRTTIAGFLAPRPGRVATTIEAQLRTVAEMPPGELARELRKVWPDGRAPDPVRSMMDGHRDGPERLAEAFWGYWSVAVAPYWERVRAVLDEDVAYRAGVLTRGGIGPLLSGLHEAIGLYDESLHLRIDRHGDRVLAGDGMLLVPSVFAWPHLVVDLAAPGPASLTYPARGVGTLWEAPGPVAGDDPLGALIGRNRAAILATLAVPHSTTRLAARLGQSKPAVSQHLAVLKRSGMVRSWRSGRSVLYQRTELATSVVAAGTTLPAAL